MAEGVGAGMEGAGGGTGDGLSNQTISSGTGTVNGTTMVMLQTLHLVIKLEHFRVINNEHNS